MKNLLILSLAISYFTSTGQVGIGTTDPTPSAALHINSNTGGLLIPSMTIAQRNSIASPAEGLMIYQTDNTPGFYYYSSGSWESLSSDSKWVRNVNDIYNSNTGKVGVGTTTPTAKLHVIGDAATVFTKDFETGTLSPMTTNGNQYWTRTSNAIDVFSGLWATATRSNLTHNESSNLRHTVTLPTDGSISFAVRTSTENNQDWLTFYIDDVQQDRWSGETSYRMVTFPVSAGARNFRWTYSKDAAGDAGDNRVAIDNILITSGSRGFRLQDGNETSGYVMTTDGLGYASWSQIPPVVIPPPPPALWTANGTNIYNSNTGNVGVGVTLPDRKLHVSANSGGRSTLYSENINTTTTNSYGIHGTTRSGGQQGSAGIFGESVSSGDFEIGVKGDYSLWGAAIAGIGWGTSVSDMPRTGGTTGSNNDMGVYGGVSFSSGIGVYGLNNSTGSTAFAGYFKGNHAITGSKSASVPTTQGNQLLYSVESPEIWFEEFGKAKLINGRAHIAFDAMYQETIFVDDTHPFHVFLQEEGDSKGLYVVPDQSGNGFTVREKQDGTSNIDFSYRITAKRRFYQDHRFGVDPIQVMENNLAKAKYVTPPPSDISTAKQNLIRAEQEKMAQHAIEERKKEQERQAMEVQQTQQTESPLENKKIEIETIPSKS